MKKINNILIVAITRLGDMLQASPTIVGLRRENPDAHITVAIDKQFASICSGIPGIDEVYVLDLSLVVRCIHRGGDGIVEAYRYTTSMIQDLRERNFDYVLNMSSSPYTALMLKMLDAPDSRGWTSDEEGYRLITDPWAMLFAAFVYHSNRDYNALNLVDIFRCAAGVKDHPLSLQYVPNDDEKKFAEVFFSENITPGKGPIIALQAGASQGKRQWAPSSFAKLCQLLVEKLDARILFTGAKSEQWILDDLLKHYSHPNMVSSMGKTSFGELAALLDKVDVLITGDTGPMHLSVAVGTPVVAIFLASALCFETGPYSKGNFVVQPQIGCNPCNPNFPCSRPDCHGQVTPELIAFLTELRLKTPLGKESEIRIPAEYVQGKQAAIYYTDFDSDGFLEFCLLGGESDRNGRLASFYRVMRRCYKALWKEEFDDTPYQELPPPPADVVEEIPHESLAGLRDAIQLTRTGTELIGRLEYLVKDPASPLDELKEVNFSIEELDKKIEEIGLSYPPLGALIRIFLMEKENLRGDDVLKLASETRGLYSRLARRGRRFTQMFKHFSSDSGGSWQ